MYARGKVSIVAQNHQAVRATVQGTALYSVWVELEHPQAVARCGCMAYQVDTLCKHCVAVILQYCEPLEPKVRHNFGSELLNRGQTRAKKPIRELKKLLTKAFPKRTIHTYEQAERYFANAQPLFQEFIESAHDYSGVEYLEVLLLAYDRFNTIASSIDDSGGFRLNIEGWLDDALIGTFHQLDWSDTDKVAWLVAQAKKPREIFPYIPRDFLLSRQQQLLFNRRCSR